MKRKAQQLEIGKEPDEFPQFVWVTAYGEEVPISQDMVKALDTVNRVFPGSRATWWRKPGERWQRNG